MSTSTPMVYTQLDPTAQLQVINTRIRQLESSYLALSIRVSAPAPGDTITGTDTQNLTELAASLETLHGMATALAPTS